MTQPNPVIVGVAQYNPRCEGLAEAPEPIEMMARAARAAAEDAGAAGRLLKSLDALAVVSLLSFSYRNAPGALAARLGIEPRTQLYTTIGGNTPQSLVNHIAAEIASGRMRVAMIAGAEAVYTVRHALKSGRLEWSDTSPDGTPTPFGDSRPGTNALEERYGAQWPVQIYPLFENARRVHHRWTLAAHRVELGRMCAAMTRVAASNRYAWFAEPRSAEQITTVSADNRMICFPYPKLMNAVIDVDLAAAVILAGEDEASRLGIARDRMVYIHAGADATEHGYFVSERENYFSSPAMKRAMASALRLAGVAVDAIGYFDFYSCFPIAVGLALDALGLKPDDPRGVTVTGGLPYAGGPGNNYVTHSIAAMVELLRKNPGKLGMVTALGWYFTKHAAAIYSTAPPRTPFARDDSDKSRPANLAAPVKVVEQAEGPATIETYTVVHDHAGAPQNAIVVERLDTGQRFFAGAPREIIAAMESEEFVGRRGRVRVVDGLNLFEPQ